MRRIVVTNRLNTACTSLMAMPQSSRRLALARRLLVELQNTTGVSEEARVARVAQLLDWVEAELSRP